MDTSEAQSWLEESLGDAVELLDAGDERFYVQTPLQYPDGDHFVILLKREGGSWFFTDEAHSFMRLSYTMDLDSLEGGRKQEIVESALQRFGLNELKGALRKRVDDRGVGVCFFEFCQALVQVYDVRYAHRPRSRSTFKSELRSAIYDLAGSDEVKERWYDSDLDREGTYKVDYRIETEREETPPAFVFGINTNRKAQESTITVYRYSEWGYDFRALGVLESEKKITNKAKSQFEDAAAEVVTFDGPILKENAKSAVANLMGR